MANKIEILEKIEKTGVVAVLRLYEREKLEDIVASIVSGGVNIIEITYTSSDPLEMISSLTSGKMANDIIVGAGTVTDKEKALQAIKAGAQFIVSPILDLGVIDVARKNNVACVSGGFTPTEILTAWNAGADVIKVFPATSVGPQYLKDIHGPLPEIKLSPTGGVDLSNAGDFISKGAAFIGVGTALLNKKFIADSNWEGLSNLARQFKTAVETARGVQ